MNENKPIVSIFGAAHRVELWLEFYKNIKTNLPFEIVFVSDKKPEFKLPPEFHYIYSPVKPCQCSEIALRACKGDILLWTADDLIHSPYAIDEAYKIYKEVNDFRTMVRFRIFEGNTSKHPLGETTNLSRLFNRTSYGKANPRVVDTTPMVMMGGLISKKVIDEVGRLDRNFLCGNWENDLQLRIMAKGGKIILSEKSIIYNDCAKHGDENNYRGPVSHYEQLLLAKLWVKDGKFTFERQQPVEFFEDKDLLTISQGPKGITNSVKYVWK